MVAHTQFTVHSAMELIIKMSTKFILIKRLVARILSLGLCDCVCNTFLPFACLVL